MIKKIYVFCVNFSKAFNKKNVSDYAASAAFFLFLSLIPLLMLLFSILPYTVATEQELLDISLRYIPDTMYGFITGIINEIYANSAGIITVTALVTLWSAGKGMQALIRGLNSINDIVEIRGFFILRALACLYTVIMLAATIIMMVLLMFGKSLFRIILMYIPELYKIRHLILYLRYPVSWLVLVILFEVIYCFVPSKNQKFVAQLPGAIFSAIIWSIASFGFSVYLHFNDFSTYGSMATVIIVMIYMYMMMYIVFVGAYLNNWLGRSISSEVEDNGI